MTYASDIFGYNASAVRKRLPKDGAVLLSGGGNFGDLWPGHQRLRETVATDLTEFRLVQLPQSIYFQDPKKATIANQVLSKHPNFLLLLRDTPSMERAKKELPDVQTLACPDMALGYEPPHRDDQNPKKTKILVIARNDQERASGLHAITPEWLSPHQLQISDWWSDAREPLAWQAARLPARANRFFARSTSQVSLKTGLRVKAPRAPEGISNASIRKINDINVSHALKLYSSTRAMVVDRLHAHILAVLLGIDHVILDNSYHKIKAVYDDYTHVFDTAQYAFDLEDAMQKLKGLFRSC